MSTLKILLVNNYYQSSAPSGEDGVFKEEMDLLKSTDVGDCDATEVVSYERFNDEIKGYSLLKKLTLPIRMIWSTKSYNEMRDLLKKEMPDIVHFSNIWYLISPSAYYACYKANVPVVQTLQNFRIFCANGLLMRNGSVCEKCVGKLPWRGILYGCFRGSRLLSVPVVLTLSLHKKIGTWKKRVDAYIAATEFGREKYVEGGLPSDKVFVKPNFFTNPPTPSFLNQGYAIFLGRVAAEKGLNVLIDAITVLNEKFNVDLPVKILGDGPLYEEIQKKLLDNRFQNVSLLGNKGFDECIEYLKGARFLIMPSLWYEGFPMVIREAFACGKPVIASRLGAMTSIIEDGKTGLFFEPGNASDLALRLKWMLENEKACSQMGRNAHVEFEAKYTAEKNRKILLDIYKQVIENSKRVKTKV